MKANEAMRVLRQELMKYRRRPYVELSRLAETRLPTVVIKGESGTEYQVVIRVHWEGKAVGDIRVIGLIDDFGWSVFFPLTSDFITGPNDIVSAVW
jgi:hypothetical protein